MKRKRSGTVWNKGLKLSPEYRAKLSIGQRKRIARDGYINSPEAKLKIIKALTGRPVSQQTRDKLRSKRLGMKLDKTWRENLSKAHMGIKRPDLCGTSHPNWKGGTTSKRQLLCHTREYKDWRMAVFTRDNYTCQWCSVRGGKLHADHIKPVSLFPELVFELRNGRTLCMSCHRKTSSWGGTKKCLQLDLL